MAGKSQNMEDFSSNLLYEVQTHWLTYLFYFSELPCILRMDSFLQMKKLFL